LAGKLAIAARADAFGGRYVSDALKADIDKRLAEIREKYEEPPPLKEKPRPEWREQRPERREERWRDRKRGKNRRARKG
jgi:nucleolar protein 56